MKNLVGELSGCGGKCENGECARCLKHSGGPIKVVRRRRRAWLRYYSQAYFRWPDCASGIGA